MTQNDIGLTCYVFSAGILFFFSPRSRVKGEEGMFPLPPPLPSDGDTAVEEKEI